MFYVDTAVFISLHCEETSTVAVRRWLSRQQGPWAVSDWTMTECVSAFGVKVRRRELVAAEAELAIDSIAAMIAESFEVLPITTVHYRQAQQWLKQFQLGLRAADALHLAVAHEAGCPLATYDKVLLAAAKALKVRVLKSLA